MSHDFSFGGEAMLPLVFPKAGSRPGLFSSLLPARESQAQPMHTTRPPSSPLPPESFLTVSDAFLPPVPGRLGPMVHGPIGLLHEPPGLPPTCALPHSRHDPRLLVVCDCPRLSGPPPVVCLPVFPVNRTRPPPPLHPSSSVEVFGHCRWITRIAPPCPAPVARSASTSSAAGPSWR